MSGEFVISFLSECMARGITKEAAAELLQRQSVLHAGESNPAWLEGYEKAAAIAPGALRPMFRDGYMEKKSAFPNARLAGDAIMDLLRAGKGMVGSAGRELAGTGRSVVGGIRKRPLLGAAAAAAATAGAAYGGYKLMGNGGGGDYEVPYMPPGGYNPDTSAANYDAQLNQYSQGIFAHNKKFFGEEARRQELQAAVDSHAPGSDMALAELNKMKQDHSSASNVRQKYFDSLNQAGSKSEAKLKEIEAQQSKMESAKTDLWHAPYRGWLHMTGRNPEEYYDNERAKLEGGASAAANAKRLIDDQRNRLSNGTIESTAKSRTPAQMQADFFPAYNK